MRARSMSPEEEEAKRYRSVTWKSCLVCWLPACCDLGGTTLSGIGLLYTSASVFQMLRGSIIFFTAVLSVIFLGRKLKWFHYIGASLTVIGITLVGLSSQLHASASASGGSMVLVGDVMVILSQLMSATQVCARAPACARACSQRTSDTDGRGREVRQSAQSASGVRRWV
jgi:drug/metabolite transporter (DMT)-like permease